MTDVIVVGGGVIGLSAALRLQEHGARVTVWTAHEPAETVSSVAAAVWYPSHTDGDPRLLRWATAAYAEFCRQAEAGVPGVLLRRTRMVFRRRLAGLPWWAPAPGRVDLRDGAGPYAQELLFDAPLAEMDKYLPWLRSRVLAAGGTIEKRQVKSLSAVRAPVVVNATGLAAGTLCNDPDVFPARGQVVLVDNPGIDESVRDEENPAGVTYVHPRTSDVVLGGTFEIGATGTRANPVEAAAILRRCVALEPRLAGARIRGARVGLRPARRGGPRVAAVAMPDGHRLIHAYGHGGAGMTLSWGCADEIAALSGSE